MQTFSIRKAFKAGWELFKNNKTVLIVSTFIMMVAGSFSSSHERAFRVVEFSSILIAVAIWIVVVILKIGWTKLLLKLLDGEVTSVKEMIQHSNLFWKYLGTNLLYALMVSVGFVLLIIPGFYLMLKYGFAPIIIIDEHVSIRGAFKKSAEITQGVKWKLLGLIIVVALANILGACIFFVGLFVSIPVSSLAYLSVYRKLINKSA